MQYEVLEVDTDDLPEGMTHVIVEREDAPPLLLLAGEVARCWRLMREWEDTIEPSWQPTVTIPLRPASGVGWQALARSAS